MSPSLSSSASSLFSGEMGNIVRATGEQVTEGIDASRLTVIITGGGSGIGAATARVMALRGAHVIIGARNTVAAESVKQSILQKTPSARIDIMHLELSSQISVRDFADRYLSKNLPLNILINNAGVMHCPFELSEDWIEMQFATNHMGHFLLTNLLLPKLKSTAKETGIEGRIVNLSSADHLTTYRGGISFEKINDEDAYNAKLAYGQSKLANILHANELARRLREEGANVTANSVHPGFTVTNLGRHSTMLAAVRRAITHVDPTRFFRKSVSQGAATTCYVALHPSVEGISGKYFADCNIKETTVNGRNEALARRLWNYSEEFSVPFISVIID